MLKSEFNWFQTLKSLCRTTLKPIKWPTIIKYLFNRIIYKNWRWKNNCCQFIKCQEHTTFTLIVRVIINVENYFKGLNLRGFSALRRKQFQNMLVFSIVPCISPSLVKRAMYSSTRSHCAKHEIKLRTVLAGAARYRRLDSLSSESKWAKFSSANLAERGDEMWVRRRPTFSGKQNWKRTRRLSGPNGSARAEWNAPETAPTVCAPGQY